MTAGLRKTWNRSSPRPPRLDTAFALALALATGCGAGATEPQRPGDRDLSACIPAAATASASGRAIPFFPSASGAPGRQGFARVVNRSGEAGEVSIAAFDDEGESYGPLTLSLDANETAHFNSDDLENGNPDKGLTGCTGMGRGDWRLELASELDIEVLSYVRSGDGFLASIHDTVPWEDGGFRVATFKTDGIHIVPLFPAASDPLGRQGFVRVINRSDATGEVSIQAFDDTDREYEALVLSLGANETKHFNSNDLETGGEPKGLTGSTGAGIGDWHLALTSDLEIEVLAYVRTADGLLTAMHDTVSRAGDAHRVATFNPGANVDQASRLRLVNAGGATAQVTITGTDDRGEPAAGAVSVAVAAGAARTLTARELEAGGDGFEGALGEGAGKWQLVVESEQPIVVMNLVTSPTGHLANLSTRQADALTFSFGFHRGAQGFVADFADYPPVANEGYELTSDFRPLPSPLEPRSALFISGVNHSDDLFMFFKGRIGGLVPGAPYAVAVSVEIATDTRTGCFGIGGAPGESVFIKAGASAVEPLPVLVGAYLRMNIDIGSQSVGGDQAVVLGDIANSRPCEQSRQWERKSFRSRSLPAPLLAPADGRTWLLFGSDSGFEGRTDVYFTRASVAFTPI